MIVISGNDIAIINGKVVGETKNRKKIDEKKSERASEIKKILINSSAIDVRISTSNTSNVDVNLHGEAYVEGKIDFNVYVLDHELVVKADINGYGVFNELIIDIIVPENKLFEEINFKSSSADLEIGKSVYANCLKLESNSGDFTLHEGVLVNKLSVESSSGDLETDATFTYASIVTVSGDIELYTDAQNDIGIEIYTTSGDVNLQFNNIGKINVSKKTVSGSFKNKHKENGKYNANLSVSTISGDIKIK